VVTPVCVSVSLSLAAFPHYCTDPDVSWVNGRGCPLVVHCWADLQSVHGFRCYDNSAEREMSASACTRSMPGLRVLIYRLITTFLHLTISITFSSVFHFNLASALLHDISNISDVNNIRRTFPAISPRWSAV